MTTNTPGASDVQPPKVTGRETRAAMLDRAIRQQVPLRKTFVQDLREAESRHGPLKDFVHNGDLRGLRAYLMVVACCSAVNEDGWTTTHDSAVWARLLDADVAATGQSARTAAWRTLQRLQQRSLIQCVRRRGSSKISVTLLREDGSGAEYTRPLGETEADRYFNIPNAFWRQGYDEQIDVPGLAMLLTVAREKPWSAFPAERAPEWYGWSPDTHLRGLKKLVALGLAERRATYRKTPLSPTGSTLVYEYCLSSQMRPRRGKSSAAPANAGNGK